MNFSWETRKAHRYAWTITSGPIPAGLLVCHRCDNPPCCNPAHLFLGTHRDNSQDMVKKNRVCRGGAPPRGRRNPTYQRATLSEEAVASIRARYAQGGVSQRALGAEFGVTQTTIGRVVRGEAWPEVAPSL